MLAMRPDCKNCGSDLAPEAAGAWICSLECTYCGYCAEGPLDRICPGCGGDLQPRPMRAARLLERYPPSSEPQFKG